MKIDLNSIDKEQFDVKEGEIAGETCYLIQPNHIGAKWTRDNLHFRSSIWNEKGELISAGLAKFKNWAEDIELFPLPTVLDKTLNLIEKIDGSSLIVSRYKGQLIHRTRGTYCAKKLENGHEIEYLKSKYPLAFEFGGWNYGGEMTAPFSLIYEWTSPLNKIVLDYGPEPELYLIGIVDHMNYSLTSQDHLNQIAAKMGVKRPKTYYFNTIPEMIKAVDAFDGVEGICVYYNNDQNILKLKAAKYLAQHRFKENANLNSVIDLYTEFKQPPQAEFLALIEARFDFECLQLVLPLCKQVCAAAEIVKKDVDKLRDFVQYLPKSPSAESNLIPEQFSFIDQKHTRKLQAARIMADFAGPEKALARSICFGLLDNREPDAEQIKKLILSRIESESKT